MKCILIIDMPRSCNDCRFHYHNKTRGIFNCQAHDNPNPPYLLPRSGALYDNYRAPDCPLSTMEVTAR
jgi:hypothetical protein